MPGHVVCGSGHLFLEEDLELPPADPSAPRDEAELRRAVNEPRREDPRRDDPDPQVLDLS